MGHGRCGGSGAAEKGGKKVGKKGGKKPKEAERGQEADGVAVVVLLRKGAERGPEADGEAVLLRKGAGRGQKGGRKGVIPHCRR